MSRHGYSSDEGIYLHNLAKLVGNRHLPKRVICAQGHEKRDDRLCGLVVRVPGYRSRGPGLIPGAIRFSERWVWNRVHSASRVQLKSYLEEEVAAPV
jgi:hypothetical protein